jgi:hypothetical protein
VQVPPRLGQVEPLAVQALPTQQPPLLQLSPAQQTSPGVPQGEHVPVPLPRQMVPAELQAWLAQQGCPLPPQARQVPLLQIEVEDEQVLPEQHASPGAPQVGTAASTAPASTALVRVAVAVVVEVVVGAVVEVTVLDCVRVLVVLAVAVVDGVVVDVAVVVCVRVLLVVAVAVLVEIGTSTDPASEARTSEAPESRPRPGADSVLLPQPRATAAATHK